MIQSKSTIKNVSDWQKRGNQDRNKNSSKKEISQFVHPLARTLSNHPDQYTELDLAYLRF